LSHFPPHVRSIHGILVLKNKHPQFKQLRKHQNQPSLHGHQVWQSSYMIMEYLFLFPLQDELNIMEIGCGWGLLGIFCAKHFQSDVELVDADAAVFPYIDAHTQLNNVQLKTQQATFAQLTDTDFQDQDIILGGDICFWPEMARELKALVVRALLQGVKRIILADPGRPPFLELAEYCQEYFNARLVKWRLKTAGKSTGVLLIIDNPRFCEGNTTSLMIDKPQ